MTKSVEVWILGYNEKGFANDFEELIQAYPCNNRIEKIAKEEAMKDFDNIHDANQVLDEKDSESFKYELRVEVVKKTRDNSECIDIIASKEILWDKNRITRIEWNKKWGNGSNILPLRNWYNDFSDAVYVTDEDSVDEIFDKYFKFENSPFAFSAPKYRLCLNMILDLLNTFGISFEKIDSFKKKVIDELDKGWKMYFDFDRKSFRR